MAIDPCVPEITQSTKQSLAAFLTVSRERIEALPVGIVRGEGANSDKYALVFTAEGLKKYLGIDLKDANVMERIRTYELANGKKIRVWEKGTHAKGKQYVIVVSDVSACSDDDAVVAKAISSEARAAKKSLMMPSDGEREAPLVVAPSMVQRDDGLYVSAGTAICGCRKCRASMSRG